MKRILFSLIGILVSFGFIYGKNTPPVDTISASFETTKFIVPSGKTIYNEKTIRISDSLIIYGTLINNGTITTKHCLIDGGVLHSHNTNNLTVTQNLTFKNAQTTSGDTQQEHIVRFSADTIFVEDYTAMISGHMTAKTVIINDTLEYRGKLGVKSILDNLIINGTILNSDNENMKLYGNIVNNNKQTCNNLNIDFYGKDKTIRGHLSFYRLALPCDTSFYTNYDSICIENIFLGDGHLIQHENAYLKIQAQCLESSPKIIANAVGNTLEYSRGGAQYLTTDECYNLLLTKKNNAILYLTSNCTINNNLTLKNKSFLHCNTHALIFTNPTAQSIKRDNHTNKKGIIVADGSIRFENFEVANTITIPLYTSEKYYAGISLKNLDEQHSTLSIDSLFGFVTKRGDSSNEPIQYEFINMTWHISSQISRAEISVMWDAQSEQDLFEHEFCNIYHSNNNTWGAIDSPSVPSTRKATGKTNLDGYFTVGNTTIVLPIELEEFLISSNGNLTQLIWKQTHAASPFYVEKSCNGIDFFQIATIETNPIGIYEYIDNETPQSSIVYYRLFQITTNGMTSYSPIRTIQIPSQTTFSCNKNMQTVKHSITNFIETAIVDQNGNIIIKSNNNVIPIQHLPHGTYIIRVKTNNKTFQQKFVW